MTTITATADTPSVQLSIAHTSAVLRVLRTDSRGTAEVRASEGQLPTGTSGTLVLTDYEAAAGDNTYNAYMGPETRTNHHTNPAPASTAGYSNSGGVGTWSYNTSEAEPFNRFTKDAAAAITTAFNTQTAQTIPASSRVSLKTWVRSSYATNVYIRNDGTSISGTTHALAANTWTEVKMNNYAAPVSTFRLTLLISSFQPSATLDIKQSLVETATAAGAYFNGDTPDTEDVVYAWTGTAGVSRSTEITSNQMFTAAASLSLDKPWLLVPIAPNYSEQVETVTDYSAGRETQSTVHQIIGRPDPVVALGRLGTRKGNLDIFTASLEDAARVSRVFDRGEVVLLKQNVPGLDMYLAALSVDLAPYAVQGEVDTRWKLTVAYQEVVRPPGNLAGALGWTFDALALAYPSFDALLAAYASFDALTLGDTI